MIKRVVIVSGSRKGAPDSLIFGRLNDIRRSLDNDLEMIVIHGGASGVDFQAGQWCKARQIHQFVCAANWSMGKKAGPIRNEIMVEVGSIFNLSDDVHVSIEAFPLPLPDSSGTRSTMKLATSYNIELNVFEIPPLIVQKSIEE